MPRNSSTGELKICSTISPRQEHHDVALMGGKMQTKTSDLELSDCIQNLVKAAMQNLEEVQKAQAEGQKSGDQESRGQETQSQSPSRKTSKPSERKREERNKKGNDGGAKSKSIRRSKSHGLHDEEARKKGIRRSKSHDLPDEEARNKNIIRQSKSRDQLEEEASKKNMRRSKSHGLLEEPRKKDMRRSKSEDTNLNKPGSSKKPEGGTPSPSSAKRFLRRVNRGSIQNTQSTLEGDSSATNTPTGCSKRPTRRARPSPAGTHTSRITRRRSVTALSSLVDGGAPNSNESAGTPTRRCSTRRRSGRALGGLDGGTPNSNGAPRRQRRTGHSVLNSQIRQSLGGTVVATVPNVHDKDLDDEEEDDDKIAAPVSEQDQDLEDEEDEEDCVVESEIVSSGMNEGLFKPYAGTPTTSTKASESSTKLDLSSLDSLQQRSTHGMRPTSYHGRLSSKFQEQPKSILSHSSSFQGRNASVTWADQEALTASSFHGKANATWKDTTRRTSSTIGSRPFSGIVTTADERTVLRKNGVVLPMVPGASRSNSLTTKTGVASNESLLFVPKGTFGDLSDGNDSDLDEYDEFA
eukprot:Sro1497_g277630.2  (580) ;mRNA; f:19606-21345